MVEVIMVVMVVVAMEVVTVVATDKIKIIEPVQTVLISW